MYIASIISLWLIIVHCYDDNNEMLQDVILSYVLTGDHNLLNFTSSLNKDNSDTVEWVMYISNSSCEIFWTTHNMLYKL